MGLFYFVQSCINSTFRELLSFWNFEMEPNQMLWSICQLSLCACPAVRWATACLWADVSHGMLGWSPQKDTGLCFFFKRGQDMPPHERNVCCFFQQMAALCDSVSPGQPVVLLSSSCLFSWLYCCLGSRTWQGLFFLAFVWLPDTVWSRAGSGSKCR